MKEGSNIKKNPEIRDTMVLQHNSVLFNAKVGDFSRNSAVIP